MDEQDIWIEAKPGLIRLFEALRDRGYDVHGLTEKDGSVVFGPIGGPESLPLGRVSDAAGGQIRIRDSGEDRYFDKTLPMQAAKPYVYPPQETLCRFGADFTVSEPAPDAPKIALIGVRACDLAALDVLGSVFRDGPFSDARFAVRRENLMLIAVDCAHPLETCFCSSMGTGPHATTGFDVALTELSDGAHGFVARANSPAGRELLADLGGRPANADDREAKDMQRNLAASAMGRHMPPDAESLVKNSHNSPHWEDVAARCLSCANCTMVCPTCFCSTVDDRNALDGTAWRERRWDSCFSISFSYIHGGAVRESVPASYRQWITHKLGHWHDQFDRSGCVGCGRCIAWCPVGIDITAEVAALAGERVDVRSTEGGRTSG